MKSKLMSILAIGLLAVLTACSSGVSKLESLADDADKNGQEWSETEWKSKTEEFEKVAKSIDEKKLSDEETDRAKSAAEKFAGALIKYGASKAGNLLKNSLDLTDKALNLTDKTLDLTKKANDTFDDIDDDVNSDDNDADDDNY